METLPWNQIGIGSGWALVAAFVWLIFTGRLIPKTSHDREMEQAAANADRAQHDGNEWRTESRIKDQQLLEKDIQLRHMEEVGTTVNAVMRAVQSLRRPRADSEDET